MNQILAWTNPKKVNKIYNGQIDLSVFPHVILIWILGDFHKNSIARCFCRQEMLITVCRLKRGINKGGGEAIAPPVLGGYWRPFKNSCQKKVDDSSALGFSKGFWKNSDQNLKLVQKMFLSSDLLIKIIDSIDYIR